MIGGKQWNYGIRIGCFIVLFGALLQYFVGPVEWEWLAFPVNIIVLAVYIGLLMGLQMSCRHQKVIRWMTSIHAAVPSLSFALILTMLMGIIRQVSDDSYSDATGWGLSNMLTFWPFVLTYGWLTILLGLVTISRLIPFRVRNLSFIFNHLGLWMVLVCAALGRPDIVRLKMIARTGIPESRAIARSGRVHDLPFRLTLQRFTLDEYPPMLLSTLNSPGITIDSCGTYGCLGDWNIRIKEILLNARPESASAEDVVYVPSEEEGSTTAVLVKATNQQNGQVKEGWVSCGNYQYSPQGLQLDERVGLMMPVRMPSCYTSDVTIDTDKDRHFSARIQVNKPLKIEGWTIYQVGYDERMGRWSPISVLECIYDPWLSYVYCGVGLLFAGALGMFVSRHKGKEDES